MARTRKAQKPFTWKQLYDSPFVCYRRSFTHDAPIRRNRTTADFFNTLARIYSKCYKEIIALQKQHDEFVEEWQRQKYPTTILYTHGGTNSMVSEYALYDIHASGEACGISSSNIGHIRDQTRIDAMIVDFIENSPPKQLIALQPSHTKEVEDFIQRMIKHSQRSETVYRRKSRIWEMISYTLLELLRQKYPANRSHQSHDKIEHINIGSGVTIFVSISFNMRYPEIEIIGNSLQSDLIQTNLSEPNDLTKKHPKIDNIYTTPYRPKMESEEIGY